MNHQKGQKALQIDHEDVLFTYLGVCKMRNAKLQNNRIAE